MATVRYFEIGATLEQLNVITDLRKIYTFY